jgi:hypothetical protein
MGTKVIIEQRNLVGSEDSSSLQTIATVYIDGREYRVHAPAKASGDPLEWFDHLEVRQPSPIGFGSELGVDAATAVYIKKLVREELERLADAKESSGDARPGALFYHVRFHILNDANIETRFDLTRAELDSRILERYQNHQPVVVSGRTIAIDQIDRIEVFETPYPSSQFEPMTKSLSRSVPHDCFAGEPNVRNITDEVITTPSVTVLPQKADAIELLCDRFDIVAKQLRKRREQRPTLDVGDEYDVQDLLHALLRIFVDDVRPEERTPSYAGKSTRMDFLLPAEQIVVEVKKTRQGLGATELGTELIEDITRYRTHPSCKQLICFVYDPESRVANPRGIEHDLSRNEADFNVKVIIAP